VNPTRSCWKICGRSQHAVRRRQRHDHDRLGTVCRAQGGRGHDDVAKAAAKSVIAIEDKGQLATKADLSSLKVELITWNLGAIIAVAGLVSTIVALLRHG
jgi:hypothetical protein